MASGDIVFLAVSFVLIAAWTAYNISTMRKRNKLWRELKRLAEESKAAAHRD